VNRPLLLILIATVLFSGSAEAICPLRLRVIQPTVAGERVKLQWDPIPGAVEYHVYENLRGTFGFTRTVTQKTTFEIAHRVTSETTFAYTVVALVDPSVASILETQESTACLATIDAVVQPDLALSKFSRRAIIPVVGSGPGANGARFKTSLRLLASAAGQRGKLFFRPAGKVASDQDPSLDYSFVFRAQEVRYEDIVAAMGATGIGSIDIVPDADSVASVPIVGVRLYNETPNGTFGTLAGAVYPFDYLRAPRLTVEVPDSRFRLNIGVRTLTKVKMQAFLFSSVSGVPLDEIEGEFPADIMIMMSAEDFLGTRLESGNVIDIGFGGSVIPFYTITENRTNDPTLVIATPPKSTNVGAYVE
jgi:hypothetical protein